MTVEVDSGPGAGWASTRFTATVNGSASYVYGYARTTTMATRVWAYGASPEISWIKFGTDLATTAVSITRLAGAITSYTIYPGNVDCAAAIVAGKLVLQVPLNKRIYIEINGDQKNVLMVFADPLKAAVPASKTNFTTFTPKTVSAINTGTNTITTSSAHGFTEGMLVHITSDGTYPTISGGALDQYTSYYVKFVDATNFKLALTSGGAEIDITGVGSGTITFQRAQWTDTVNALYFPAGVHTIGRGFYLASNTHVYLERGAVVIGGFWTSDSTGVLVDGAGALSGSYAQWELVTALTSFNEQVKFAAFLGSSVAPFTGYTGNTVRGIVVFACPWYLDFRCVSTWQNVEDISPWNWNADGFSPIRDVNSYVVSNGLTEDCFAFVGDDALKVNGDSFYPVTQTVSGVFLVSVSASSILLSYTREKWSSADTFRHPHVGILEDIDVLHLGLGDIDSGESTMVAGQNSIVRAWVSCQESLSQQGRTDVTIDGLRVWGEHRGMFCTIKVFTYPYSGPGVDPSIGDFGQLGRITIRNVTYEQAPLQIGTISSVNWWNAPFDIHFDNLSVAGSPVSHRTFSQLVAIDAHAYRVFVDEVLMVTAVDICNRALAAIGQAATVTSISPADNSLAARLCATHYDPARESLLALRSWGFALTRTTLTLVDSAEDSDIDGWQFAYQIPAGMLKAIAILEPGATDDYAIGGAAQPQPFTIERHSTGDLCIYTNVEDAVLRHTVYVTDPAMFTPLFIDALVWTLASKLAGPLVKGAEGMGVSRAALATAAQYLALAAEDTANQREVKPDVTPPSLAVR